MDRLSGQSRKPKPTSNCRPPSAQPAGASGKEKMVISRIAGLIAAPFTPFHADGQLNLRMIERQAAHLIASGVSGAFICGTTGESASLTIAERKLIAQRWVEVAGRELAIIVHTGHNCLADSRELAAHA